MINAPETFSVDWVSNTGTFTITITNPAPDTDGETVTAYAKCPGETTVTLGTTSGAVAGTTLTIDCNDGGLLAGISYQLHVGSPSEDLIPNDTDGHYFIRRRSL